VSSPKWMLMLPLLAMAVGGAVAAGEAPSDGDRPDPAYKILRSVVAASAASGTTVGYELRGTLGQPSPPGEGATTGYMLSGGFWAEWEPAGDYTLCDIAENDADGVPILLGEQVEVAGVATVASGTWHPTEQHFQITDGECCTIALGSVGVLDTGVGLPDPPVVATGDHAANGEEYESCLLRFSSVEIVAGTWPAEGESAWLAIDDGSGVTSMWIDADTDIDGSPPPVGTFTVCGIGWQYDDTLPYFEAHMLQPRGLADFDFGSAVGDPDAVPRSLYLASRTPSSRAECAQLDYGIPDHLAGSRVTLRVFDLSGRLVRTLVDEPRSAGSYSVLWDGMDACGGRAGSGVYFSRLDVAGEKLTRRVVVLR
jgi:hypothetical protein